MFIPIYYTLQFITSHYRDTECKFYDNFCIVSMIIDLSIFIECIYRQ